MKNSATLKFAIVALGLLATTQASADSDRILRRWFLGGDKAQTLYKALYLEPRADHKKTEREERVDIGEGALCTANDRCITWSHDGDEKVLRNSKAIAAALSEAGIKLNHNFDKIECTEENDTRRVIGHYCTVEEEISHKIKCD